MMVSLRFLYMLMVLSAFSVMLQSRDVSESEDFNSANDDIVIENEGDSLPPLNVFEPTWEWKVIEEGQSVPAGLHVRINLQTGLKEAKLLENDEDVGRNEQVDTLEQKNPLQEIYDHKSQGGTGENAALHTGGDAPSNPEVDERRAHYYGKSDRRGIINKRTKVFTKQELSEMLKKLNHDNVDYGMLPGITSSNSVKVEASESNTPAEQPKFTYHDVKDRLPLTAHRDIEIMLEHTQLLANREATVPELLHSLEELEYHVHQIDNAKDLNVIGGLVLVVRLLNHSDPDVRSHAAHVIGSAAQRSVNCEATRACNLYLVNSLTDLLYSSDILVLSVEAMGSFLIAAMSIVRINHAGTVRVSEVIVCTL